MTDTPSGGWTWVLASYRSPSLYVWQEILICWMHPRWILSLTPYRSFLVLWVFGLAVLLLYHSQHTSRTHNGQRRDRRELLYCWYFKSFICRWSVVIDWVMSCFIPSQLSFKLQSIHQQVIPVFSRPPTLIWSGIWKVHGTYEWQTS